MSQPTKTQLRANRLIDRLFETQDWLTFLLDMNEDLWDLRRSIGRKQTYLNYVYEGLKQLGIAT